MHELDLAQDYFPPQETGSNIYWMAFTHAHLSFAQVMLIASTNLLNWSA
jgi:hypothetical protein